MVYDYIIIGSGLGGLSAGINLALNNKKVLILEKNSLPGGLVTTFKRGRFEFDTSLYDLYDYGSEENSGTIKNLFKKYDIDIETIQAPLNFKVKTENNEDYEVKGNIEDFILELENLKNGSTESLKEFIAITKEVHEALNKLKNNFSINEEEYPRFNKYLRMNVIDALTDINMPKETIHRLGYLWLYIGSPLNKLNFIDFAEFMYKFIFKKTYVLRNKNLDLILKMVNKFKEYNGNIYYNEEVINISDINDLKLIITKTGNEYKCKHVICNLSQRYVYKNLFKEPNLEVNKLENARTLSMNGVVVYLGLNKNHSNIGLNNYKYYHFNNINSLLNIKNMNSLYHNIWEATVPNVVNMNASPNNTTILVLKTNYYDKTFNITNINDYKKIKEDIALDLINQFEETFNIDIREYIEEIEIATPLTFSRYTNNVNGSMLGYMRLGYDNSIHRLISYKDEIQPKISFVGGSSLFGGGADNAIYSGYYISKMLLKVGDNNE